MLIKFTGFRGHINLKNLYKQDVASEKKEKQIMGSANKGVLCLSVEKRHKYNDIQIAIVDKVIALVYLLGKVFIGRRHQCARTDSL